MIRVSKKAQAKTVKEKNELIDISIDEIKTLTDKKLNELIKEINGLDPDDYDEDEYELYKERLAEAKRIMNKREEATEMEEKKRYEKLDDGTVRGLIISGDYRDCSNQVLVYNTFFDEPQWEVRRYFKISGALFDCKKKKGDMWSVADYKLADAFADKIILICRRRLKKSDIVMCAFSIMEVDNYVGSGAISKRALKNKTSGLVFTQEQIFVIENGELDYIIDYREIADIDFENTNNDSLTITIETGETVELTDLKDNTVMYNLLMDIKERV